MSSNPYQTPVAAPAPVGPDKPFPVMVKSDPRKLAKGQFTCQVTPQGVTLVKGKKQEFRVLVGDGAEYLGKNRFAVPVENGRLELTLSGYGRYYRRLARDVVNYLNGQGPMPVLDNYKIPWMLFLLVMLPLGIPIITLGGALPAMIGCGLVGANFAIVQNEDRSVAGRVGLCLLLTGVAYAGFVAILVVALTAGGM